MHKKYILFLILIFFTSCSGYEPIYKKNNNTLLYLQNLVIVTDEKKISNKIKKVLLELLPVRSKIEYVLKIETTTSTNGTVSNIDTKVSRYEIHTEMLASLYKRKKYDQLIFQFKERRISPYSLSSNEVLSTLSGRQKAESLAVKNLSETVFDRLIIYFIQNKKNVS